MQPRAVELGLIRAGFFLFVLALITGLAIPAFVNPRMAVASHLNAILGALVLIAVGLSWSHLAFSPIQAKLTRIAFLYSAFAAWVASALAAAWGTSRLTPIAGAGHSGAPWQETLVQGLQGSIVVTILGGALSVLYALRPASIAAERAESVF